MELTFYVNDAYDREVTLGNTLDSDIGSFGDVTWRTLISDILFESTVDDDELEQYGIISSQLDEKLKNKDVDQFYTQLADYFNNTEGSNAVAFDLIRRQPFFLTDKDGNGASNGVELIQTTDNGPRKFVYFKDKKAEKWILNKFVNEGYKIEIIHV